ncbi:MAG: GMP synthase (glutamine-hydrolyzing), partial [Burkholderiaceae bacterium]
MRLRHDRGHEEPRRVRSDHRGGHAREPCPRRADHQGSAQLPRRLSRAPTPPMQHDKILILDFGSQVTQLIARRVREAH